MAKDSTGMQVITPDELSVRCYRGETIHIKDGNDIREISRVKPGYYAVNGAGEYTLESIRSFYGHYHAEFGSAVFFPAA